MSGKEMRDKIPWRAIEPVFLMALFAVAVLVASNYLDGAVEGLQKNNLTVSGLIASFASCILAALTVYLMKDNDDCREIVVVVAIVFSIALASLFFGTQAIINGYQSNKAMVNPILSVALPFGPWFVLYQRRRGWHWPWSRIQ